MLVHFSLEVEQGEILLINSIVRLVQDEVKFFGVNTGKRDVELIIVELFFLYD